jgi:hypothetical protein
MILRRRGFERDCGRGRLVGARRAMLMHFATLHQYIVLIQNTDPTIEGSAFAQLLGLIAYPYIIQARTKSNGSPRYQCSNLSDISRVGGILPTAKVVGRNVVHREWEVVEVGETARIQHWADVLPSWENCVVCDEVVEVVCFHVN